MSLRKSRPPEGPGRRGAAIHSCAQALVPTLVAGLFDARLTRTGGTQLHLHPGGDQTPASSRYGRRGDDRIISRRIVLSFGSVYTLVRVATAIVLPAHGPAGRSNDRAGVGRLGGDRTRRHCSGSATATARRSGSRRGCPRPRRCGAQDGHGRHAGRGVNGAHPAVDRHAAC